MADEEKQQDMDNRAKQEATSPSSDMDATESARTTPLQDAPAPPTNMDVTNSQEAPATPPNPDATAAEVLSPFSYDLVLPHMRVVVSENMWNRFTHAEQKFFLFKQGRVLAKGNDDIAQADLLAKQLLEQERLQAIAKNRANISALQKALDAAKKASTDGLQHGEAKLKTLQAQVTEQQQRNRQSANALAANHNAVQHKLLLAREELDTWEGRDTTVTSDNSSGGARSPRSTRGRGKPPARHGHRDPSSSPPRRRHSFDLPDHEYEPSRVNRSVGLPLEGFAVVSNSTQLGVELKDDNDAWLYSISILSAASIPQLAFRNTKNRNDRSRVVDAASALYDHLLRVDNQTFTTRSDLVNVMSFLQSGDHHSHVSYHDFRRLADLTTDYINTMRYAYANRTNSNVNYDNHQPTAYQGRSSNARAATKQPNDWATVASASRPPRSNTSAASTSSREDNRDRGRDSDSHRKDRNTDRNDRSGHKRDRPSDVTSPTPPRRSAPARPASSAAAAAPKHSKRTSTRDEAKHSGADTTKSRQDRRQRAEVGHILQYWSGVPDQHRGTNRLYRQMRIGAAARELARNKGEPSPSPGYDDVSRDLWLRRLRYSPLPAGPTSGTRRATPCGGSEKSPGPPL